MRFGGVTQKIKKYFISHKDKKYSWEVFRACTINFMSLIIEDCTSERFLQKDLEIKDNIRRQISCMALEICEKSLNFFRPLNSYDIECIIVAAIWISLKWELDYFDVYRKCEDIVSYLERVDKKDLKKWTVKIMKIFHFSFASRDTWFIKKIEREESVESIWEFYKNGKYLDKDPLKIK